MGWLKHLGRGRESNKCLFIPALCSVIEDYAVLYFGSAMFKICRLLLIAMSSVHFFACIFFRVKKESAASPDDVAAFYSSKGVDPEASGTGYPRGPVCVDLITEY